MAYEAAINKAWLELSKISVLANHTVSLLNDTYNVSPGDRTVISNSCNVPVKEYLAILLLHYLIGSLKNSYCSTNIWIPFAEIDGGAAYYPAYRKSVIETLLRKYGNNPEGLFGVLERFKGKKLSGADAAIELVTFKDIFLRIIMWKSDNEFGPEATILFDKEISKIYSMEDVVVFSHFIISNI